MAVLIIGKLYHTRLIMYCKKSGKPLKELSKGMFENYASLYNIHQLTFVEEIGLYAFRNYASLPSVIISNSVLTICHPSFQGCSSLKAVRYPFLFSPDTFSESYWYDIPWEICPVYSSPLSVFEKKCKNVVRNIRKV